MPLDIGCVSPQLHYTEDDVHKVLANYGRKLKDLEIDLESIKEWFKTQPHIPEMPSDRLIASFLLMNKFSIEKTKARLEMNYSIRNVMPDIYSNGPLQPKFRDSHTFCKIFAMPKLTKDLRRLCYIKFDYDACYDPHFIVTRIITNMELLAICDFSRGDEYICDYTNVNLSMISKIKPTDLKKLSTIIEKVYANRILVLHTVNLPPEGETLFNIFKLALKPKLREKIRFHKGFDSLKEYYGLDMFPKDYGGNAKSIDEATLDLEFKYSKLYYTEDDVHKILAIHGKNLKDLEIDLESMKEWFKTQPHIPDMPSDRLIVSYLLMNKFSIEKTKSRLEMNYSIRNVMADLYSHSPLHPKIRESHKYYKLLSVPKLTNDLRRLCIIIYRDDASLDMTLILSRMIMSIELLAMYDISNGDEYIADFTNLSLSSFTKIKPTDVRKIVTIYDKVYGNRFSVIHIVNLPAAGEALLNIFKACLKPKLRERLICHKGFETLKKYYSVDMLPKDYGGSGECINEATDDYQKFFESHDGYFSRWLQMRVDEKLRPQPLNQREQLPHHQHCNVD
ncbi:PREDICTED: uncharacterized protein LOC108562546 [Nicrophorus vespilloides]|uniref:Uncharacterized protein LOC108562546 n=1 Tax=Nicrophorus vespilloides TaxID=110193 RepID=A0ABM1MPB7_NICVS|nr:PREDICTED: uncharacterized protein LOC108562546 [Nicrophorus vespilloides]